MFDKYISIGANYSSGFSCKAPSGITCKRCPFSIKVTARPCNKRVPEYYREVYSKEEMIKEILK
jgi:hypothetical protein